MSEVKMPEKSDIYASQSDKMRETSSVIANSSLQAPAERKEKVRIEKVASGTVKTKKHSKLKEAFFGEHVDNVKDYIIYDVMIPALKGTLEEMFGQGLHMLFFGESKKKKHSDGRVAFGSYYNGSRRDSRDSREAARNEIRGVEDVIFESERVANDVLEALMAYADEYGSASVLDLYDAAGVSAGSHVDDNYGWFPRDIRAARIRRIYERRDIYYVIDLPRPVRLV